MSQSYERVVTRLNNLKAIEPLLGALRTISLGTWQMAQNKLVRMTQFEAHFNRVLLEILPAIQTNRTQKKNSLSMKRAPVDAFILIVGSERGLCGKFNQTLAENALRWISEQDFQSIELGAVGSRMIQTLSKMDVSLSWQRTLPTGDLASYRRSYLLIQDWINKFESYQFNKLIVVFNELIGQNKFQFSVVELLPYETIDPDPLVQDAPSSWPSPIIETDPKGIFNQIIQHYVASTFYKILLRSAISENSSRYLLMEEAKQNAKEIIEELNLEVNTERKRKITQDMQELAVGAGLIDNKEIL